MRSSAASETEGASAADAGLEIGDRNETSDEAVLAGYASGPAPEAGATVEEGAEVDVAVDPGAEQVSAATQTAPTNDGAAGRAARTTCEPAAPKAADPNQVPAAVQEAPSSVGAAGPRQDAPTTARAASASIQSASGSSVSDKKKQKGKKTEQKGKK